MKIMVTGSEGYIGSCLVPTLVRDGAEVVRFDKKLGCDLLDFDSVDRAVEGCDWIIHLAGLVGIAACEKDPVMACQVNVDTTANLLRYRKPMIFTSVLAGYQQSDVDESTPVFPTATYYKTKIEAETMVQNQGQTILRFGALYGVNAAAMRDDLLVHSFCREAVRTGKITIFQPQAMRPLTHLREAVKAIKFMMGPQRKGIFHVVTRNLRKERIANAIGEVIGCDVVPVEGRDEEGRDYRVSRNKLITTGFKYAPQPFVHALEDIVDWYKL